MTSVAGQSVSAGGQHVLAEDLLFQRAARPATSMDQTSRGSRGLSPVSSEVMTRRPQASWMILLISASTSDRVGGALPRARVAASSSNCRGRLASVTPSKPRARCPGSPGDWVTRHCRNPPILVVCRWLSNTVYNF